MPNCRHAHDGQGRHGITIHRGPPDISFRRIKGTCLFILTPNEELDTFLHRIIHLVGVDRNDGHHQDTHKAS